MSRSVGVGIVKSSTRRADVVRKLIQRTSAVGTAGSREVLSEDSASRAARIRGTRLAKSITEFPQVLRTPAVDARDEEKTSGVLMEWN